MDKLINFDRNINVRIVVGIHVPSPSKYFWGKLNLKNLTQNE